MSERHPSSNTCWVRTFQGCASVLSRQTDRFTAILHGDHDKIIPGAALCSQAHRPFGGLNPFGNNFLSRMEGSECDAAILRNITLVDTPGILSGQKQRTRNYDYESVIKWFAERSDLIIIMFDAHKLDISDELKRAMELMIPHLDKVRVVLNKADSISTQQLMRVYGALMWSLGKVMNTPEVCRVYMGSFWDAPLQNTEQADLLQRGRNGFVARYYAPSSTVGDAAYQRTCQASAKCESSCVYYSLFAQTTSVHVGKKGETETTHWTAGI